jgi:gamma-glutamyltranspeptidase/glutathione hydrolase
MTARGETWTLARPAVVSDGGGVVTAQNFRAADAGAAALGAGGNAVDAVVTTALALGPLEPWMSGLAASGYLLYAAPDGRVSCVDFAGRLPAGLDPARYPLAEGAPPGFLGFPAVVGDRNVVGYEAVCVPGAVDGLSTALARFGTIAWADAISPAIRLAEAGLPVDWHATLSIAMAADELLRDPAAAAVFLPGGLPPQPGTACSWGPLADTYRRLAEAGPRDFYEGGVARDVAADLDAGGSAIRLADLAAYRAEVSDAPAQAHRDAVIHGAAPGSGAARAFRALRILAERPAPSGPPGPADYVAYADALDTAFREHRAALAETPTGGSTTHLGAVDRHGGIAVVTFTLLNRFGSRVVLPRTGILMNNGVSWFDPRPGRRNSLVPGRRAPSNMCPLVATRGGRPWFGIGASGGNQIVPAVVQVASFLVDHGDGLEAALHRPRIDATGGPRVVADVDLPDDVVAALGASGRQVARAQRQVFPKPFAAPSGVLRDDAGRAHAVPDIWTPCAAARAETPPETRA